MKKGKSNLTIAAKPKGEQLRGADTNKGATVLHAKPTTQEQRQAQPPRCKTIQIPADSAQQEAAKKTAPQSRNKKTAVASDAKQTNKPAASRNKPRAKRAVEGSSLYAPALTQIHKSIVKQDSSQGFARAKHAADKALSNNNIVLNRRFVLENTLGAGGMGTVYKAKDLRKVEANDKNPYVAIKILNEDFKNHPDAFVTLQRETSRSHRLSHPKIVNVHDFDRDGEVIYMTMELLKGLPLDNVMRRVAGTGLASVKALPIIADICDAVAHAHAKGIIHCDLKPGNVFVTKEATKVLDFGIAHITAGGDDFDSSSLGALTPTYASLEMIQGLESHPSDDLYAIGIITYELLSGEHPYQRHAASKALADNLKPKKLPFLSKRQWQALEKALQLKREDRLGSIEEFQKTFFQKKNFPIFKVSSAILFCVAAALTYLTVIKVGDMNSRVQQLMQSANACVEQQDYACGLEKYQAVLSLQPDNPQAKKGQNQAEQLYTTQRYDKFLTDIEQCLTSDQDLLCARSKKEQAEALNLSEDQRNTMHQRIESYKNQQKIEQLLTQAAECLSSNQFPCAKQYSTQALAIEAHNIKALELKRQAIQLEQQQIADTVANDRRYANLLEKGKQCLNLEDFQCALSHFHKALDIYNKDKARTLKQQAEFAQQNKKISYAKASKLSDKAEDCFNKKDFSCAISNAESSLEFVSNYRRAIAIKTKAVQAQEQAKRGLTIE